MMFKIQFQTVIFDKDGLVGNQTFDCVTQSLREAVLLVSGFPSANWMIDNDKFGVLVHTPKMGVDNGRCVPIEGSVTSNNDDFHDLYVKMKNSIFSK